MPHPRHRLAPPVLAVALACCAASMFSPGPAEAKATAKKKAAVKTTAKAVKTVPLLVVTTTAPPVSPATAAPATGAPATVAPPTVAPKGPATDETRAAAALSISRDIFDRNNADRATRGLPALGWDDRLARSAADWAQQMATAGQLKGRNTTDAVHASGDTADVLLALDGMAARNPDAGSTYNSFYTSATFRRNIFHPSMQLLGIGTFCDALGVMWTVTTYGMTDQSKWVDGYLTSPAPPEAPRASSPTGGPRCPR